MNTLNITSANPVQDAAKVYQDILEQLTSLNESLNLNLVSNSSAIGLNLNKGTPTDEQLQKINQLIGRESSAGEWYVIPFMASNNLVSFSIRKWHLNVLRQMESQLLGKPLMLDHEWYSVKYTVGFLFDSKLVITSSAPEEAIAGSPGQEEKNKAITNKEGYAQLYLMGCVGRDMADIITGVEMRRLDDCSTGGWLSKLRLICPNCSENMGREVTFNERTNKGYTCPHSIPSMYSEMFASSDGDGDDEFEEPEFADYLELDGLFSGVELSIVAEGNLPAAKICR